MSKGMQLVGTKEARCLQSRLRFAPAGCVRWQSRQDFLALTRSGCSARLSNAADGGRPAQGPRQVEWRGDCISEVCWQDRGAQRQHHVHEQCKHYRSAARSATGRPADRPSAAERDDRRAGGRKEAAAPFALRRCYCCCASRQTSLTPQARSARRGRVDGRQTPRTR